MALLRPLSLLLLAASHGQASRCKPSSSGGSSSSSSSSHVSTFPPDVSSATPTSTSEIISSSIAVSSSPTDVATSSTALLVSSQVVSSSSSEPLPSSTTTSAPVSSSDTSSLTTSILASSTTPSMVASTEIPTTTTSCNTVPTYIGYPETCWISIPTVCSSLNRTPSIPWPAVTPTATSCRNSFLAGTTTPAAIAACFTNVNSPQFVGASAWACVTNADVYCKFTTAPCGGAAPTGAPPPAAQPTNILANPGFESGSPSPWTLSSTLGTDSVIGVSVVTNQERHSGASSLRAVYDNTNGGSRTYMQIVSLEPGADYEASWWYYSTNSAASTVTRMQFAGAATFVYDVATLNMPTGQWIRTSKLFTATTSFGTVRFSMFGNKANAPNTFFVDDISIMKVVT
ncbi:hypothetical protein B0H63DRAFT_139416 [Podospora didyma]|uniref:CBM-cenC domain-containing protein n=1 Tax=Podospora didyma TaxID=330526 RepID=A0AAE0NS36_9PEZI|nr:hypothetical protein B0H63DRAFT_139416 [Podospora didyma]